MAMSIIAISVAASSEFGMRKPRGMDTECVPRTYLDGHRRLAAEGQVECDHKLEGKENSRFACLNEMGAAIKDRDDSRLLNAMEDYLKKSAALGRLFPME